MSRSSIAEVHARVEGHTVPGKFLERVSRRPDATLFNSAKDGGGWNTYTAGQVRQLAAQAAQGLLDVGVSTGDRVLLMMRNRPDFHWFDLAAQFLRATPVSIYNSSAPDEIHYLADHAEAEIAIVEDAGFLEKILKIRGELPRLQHVFVIEPLADGMPAGVRAASELMSHGALDIHQLAAATEPSDL